VNQTATTTTTIIIIIIIARFRPFELLKLGIERNVGAHLLGGHQHFSFQKLTDSEKFDWLTF
jgi:hypothetical protein